MGNDVVKTAAAATTPAKSAQDVGREVVAELADQMSKVLVGAEHILRELAMQPDRAGYQIHLEPASAAVLRLAGFDPADRMVIDRQVNRVRNEINFRKTYTGPAALKEAKEALAAAEERDKAERGALQAQIDEATAKLRALHELVKAKRSRVEEMQTARDRLFECAPPFIATRAAAARQDVEGGEQAMQMHLAEAELRSLDSDDLQELRVSTNDVFKEYQAEHQRQLREAGEAIRLFVDFGLDGVLP